MTTMRLPMAIMLMLCAACASREVLLPYPAEQPGDTEFSGSWRLQGDADELEREIHRAIRETDGVRDDIIIVERGREPGRRRDTRVKGGLVYVFFENARLLKITQTDAGLFVSFDRAIVEEYRFGENRRISVGQAEAQRVSGWSGDDYVIETLDRHGMKLTERYSLSAGGQLLTRHITFRGRNKQSVSVRQSFARTG